MRSSSIHNIRQWPADLVRGVADNGRELVQFFQRRRRLHAFKDSPPAVSCQGIRRNLLNRLLAKQSHQVLQVVVLSGALADRPGAFRPNLSKQFAQGLYRWTALDELGRTGWPVSQNALGLLAEMPGIFLGIERLVDWLMTFNSYRATPGIWACLDDGWHGFVPLLQVWVLFHCYSVAVP